MATVIRQLDDEQLERPFNKKLFRRLLKYMQPYKKQVFMALGLMSAATVAALANTYLMSRAVGYLQNKDFTAVPFVLLGMVAASVTAMLCTRKRIRLMDTSGRRAIAKLREDLFKHIQGQSFSFFDTRSAGKLLVRVINDVNSLNDLFSNGIVNVLIECLTLVLLVGIMLAISWKLTLVALCILPVLALSVFKLKRMIRVRWLTNSIKSSTMNGYLHETLSGMRITQAFTREEFNSKTFRTVNNEVKRSWIKAVQLSTAFGPTLDLVGSIGTVLVYIFGVKFIRADTLALADMLAILWYVGRFWEPINAISDFYNQILTASANMERIFEIMDTVSEIQDKPGASELPPIQGRVTFDDVVFGYNAEKTVLNKVSFDIMPGQTVALVGPTGAGKSTVVNLISRFYDVTGGSVSIDGHDVRDVKLDSLRRQMSVMMQDSFIFSGTIMDNIRYGRLDATDEEVIQAAKTVYAHDFIMAMEKGYDTVVNERGSMLSQGQRQLISFARALLSDPKILILDEATSSIDTHTEMLIQKAIGALLKGRTSFVIAHRLSTIRNADLIMVVSGGNITERGTHEELIKLEGGHYRGLCEAQYRFMAGD
ncbi:MAG: ABC transporter ATP-binding protein [Clostridia bacterium]|nr:ABC transporter ATP-binding protein [Clostridia bacterium]MBR5986409.1 ABC transporter ATP-binding protein [Clostridia bacterium]MBR6009501.1 ABC transporter ATP-binding protein [Clostridia bacterium]